MNDLVTTPVRQASLHLIPAILGRADIESSKECYLNSDHSCRPLEIGQTPTRLKSWRSTVGRRPRIGAMASVGFRLT
jgi:hypothetical protein